MNMHVCMHACMHACLMVDERKDEEECGGERRDPRAEDGKVEPAAVADVVHMQRSSRGCEEGKLWEELEEEEAHSLSAE